MSLIPYVGEQPAAPSAFLRARSRIPLGPANSGPPASSPAIDHPGRFLWRVCVLVLIVAGLAVAAVTHVGSAQAATWAGAYGNGWAGDGLGNLEVGKASGRQVSLRFRADQSFTLSQIRLFFIYASGYTAGDGGQVLVSLKTDDGSAAHLPSSVTLSTALFSSPRAGNFQTASFRVPVNLSAGTLYHLVLTNPVADPVNNWTSIDDLWRSSTGSPMQPLVSDSDLAIVWKYSGTSAWTVNYHHTPIFTLIDSSGRHHGPGAPYVNARSVSGLRSIAGSNQVGESFTVSGSTRSVKNISVRVQKSGVPGALTASLRTATGSVVDRCSIPASAVTTSQTWVTCSFSSTRQLTSGQSYRLTLAAPSGDAYQVFPLSQGPGFESPSMFTDGYMQYSSNGGSSWATPSSADDMQFYFS